MKIKQISVFLENKSGRLARVTRVLAENKINIRALSIADTTDFGILRLIVNDPDTAHGILKENGFSVNVTDVIAVEITDSPGGLADPLAYLKEASINIEYLYAFLTRASQAALVVFRVEQIDEAIRVLQEKGIKILGGKDVYEML
ncbi:MAG: amino acid-binding protein [Peptococcaceae bacterium BICA1-7]|nr:MAG: amino acid-binding protein [Peptococcaceae bacterium BICA1-7]HBV96113.1 ACT domain-containing protein [Desulfotomaculum sp.]